MDVGISILLFLAHPLLLTILCFSLCSLRTISCRFRRDRKSSGHGPPTYPIIGCLFSFYKNSHRLLDWYTDLLSRSATQTIVIRRLGARRTIITANPENVEYVLKTKFTNYPKGKGFTEILDDFLGHGIFNVDGELWYTQRKLASHEFSARSLQDYIANTLVEEVESKLLPIMESLAMDHHEGGDHDHQKAVDLQELLRGLAFDVVCKLSLGIDPCCLDPSLSVSSIADAFHVASAMSAKRAREPVSVIWKIKRFLGLGSERRLKDAIREIRAFVTKTIREKKKKGILEGESGGEDLLSKMILAGHDEVFLRDMVISFIVAGRDTTSAAMTWLFYMLSQNQEVEEKVMREIIGFGEDKKLSSYEALREMRYLEACLCESMRLFPPVAWDSKHAVAGDSLPDGTAVGAGDRVTYFPYGMGRMEVLWGEDRLEFKPERWLSEPDDEGRGGRLKKVCPFKFPVFQAGPRVCLGKEMAFIQMKYIVASILKRFEIRPPGLGGRVFVPMLTAHMAGGFKVFVHRRRKPIMVTSPENSSINMI